MERSEGMQCKRGDARSGVQERHRQGVKEGNARERIVGMQGKRADARDRVRERLRRGA
jgi:hypothetical protein